MAAETVACAGCGVEVTRGPTKRRNGQRCERVYCSRRCYDSDRARRRGTCARCGASKPGASRFCSWACRQAARKPKPRPCVRCGAVFSPVKPIQRTKGVQMIGHNAGKTCSAECAHAWISENEERKRKIGAAFTGERHPNWQGGKSRLNDISYRGRGWQKRRAKALKRDGWRCVDCGIGREECRARFGRDLDVDHVEPFHNFTNAAEANRLPNLRTRCASCHRIAEAKRTGVQMVLPFSPKRGAHRGYARGERINTAKLTELDVRTIRRRAAAGEKAAGIAADYPVSESYVHTVIGRRSWKHVP